ncbi:(deoxy)nucleoside triphosphate pyrophosphohydrolase [Sphingorhabdus sp. Alg239-R122]|uniref:(deoxy)nucleoside triphosphate pyrophosphohydrolase n=1 Tax=Sphingorhabdus sp. Alg239-R122 TaxID=2305989 RepID=UPI0023DDEAB4|nr:(deoxy)nucleoside triphosphate pyrophosphohydrolase [Sphingorhabdus sp. Alg239-R122]
MQKNPTLLHVVAAAFVDVDGKVLLQKRPQTTSMAGLWEFPGGKIEAGETPEDALVRELDEELGVTVNIADLTPTCFASDALGDGHLVLLLYICRRWTGEIKALHAADIIWTEVQEMEKLPMPPADRPLVQALQRWI